MNLRKNLDTTAFILTIILLNIKNRYTVIYYRYGRKKGAVFMRQRLFEFEV